jgi:long-chain acyl-CoA synthetase
VRTRNVLIRAASVANGPGRFEMVKKVHLTMAPFSVENNTLTPTLKIKRKDAYNMYKRELDGLYTEKPADGAKL